MALHKHQCPTPTCRYIWQHDDKDIRDEEANRTAHTCINCGATQGIKYFATAAEQKRHIDCMRREDLAAIEELSRKVATGEMSMLEAMFRVMNGDLC